MTRSIPAALLSAMLMGCATAPTDPEAATPVCEAGRECNVKWRAAEQWIEHKARRAVVENTDTFMRSNMDQSPGNYLSIRVEKKRIARGEYQIEATMYCAKKVGCDPSPWEATQDFNRYVNKSWKPVRKKTGD